MNNTVNTNQAFCRFVNRQLTHKLFKLHDKGYELDFSFSQQKGLACVHDGQYFDAESVSVVLIDQVNDFLTNSWKYLHSVETACGKKGILLMEGIYGLNLKFNPVTLSFPSVIRQTA